MEGPIFIIGRQHSGNTMLDRCLGRSPEVYSATGEGTFFEHQDRLARKPSSSRAAILRQHGDDMLTLMPTNLYGPGDDFDLETAHVLPALLRKAHEAKEAAPDGTDAPVTLWGTGEPKREFLYVDDLAGAVRFVLETPEAEIRKVAPDGMLNVGVGGTSRSTT